MAVREILLLGDPMLRQKAAAVAELTPEHRTLIRDMIDTMYEAEGVGLAAPQVGVNARIIVVDVREPDYAPFALVNPEILERSGETEKGEEGCLSIPGLRDIVERPARVLVAGADAEGQEVRLDAAGLLARALQHEIDHLDGILFLDRVSPLKRQMLLKKWQKSRTE